MTTQDNLLDLEKMDRWYSEHFEELVDKYQGKPLQSGCNTKKLHYFLSPERA